jgi:hypothetical protein
LRQILIQLSNREQLFLAAIGDLMMLIKNMTEGRVADSYATGCVGEIATEMSIQLDLKAEELAWLLAFMSAGTSMSLADPPPAAAPPAAGATSEPSSPDGVDDPPAEHPGGGFEVPSGNYGSLGGLTY